MNLLFLDSIDSSIYGGMEEWIRLVASGLSQRGFGTIVAGRKGSEFLRRIAATTESVETLGLNISGDFNPVTINQLRQIISERDISTIIVNFNKDLRLGGLAARINNRTRVIWSVGLDITRDSLAHRLLTPKLCDCVITPSEALKVQICRHGYIQPESVKVIPIGIPELPLAISRSEARHEVCEKYSLSNESLIAVTSGRLVEQKGHRFLIEAVPKIVDSFPNAVFLLLGDGELKSELQGAIVAAGLTRYIIFAGMLDNVNTELAAADLMIHPSIEEPFGIALLEGMRASLPIVASRVGGIPEVVEESKTALLVPPGEPVALAEGVKRFLGSGSDRIEFGAAGQRRWRENFRFDGMIESVADYVMQISKVDDLHGSAQRN